MIPLLARRCEVRRPSFETENKSNPSKPYINVKVLPEGSDEFLTLGCKAPVDVGVYDMELSMRTYRKGDKEMVFFDLVKYIPAK